MEGLQYHFAQPSRYVQDVNARSNRTAPSGLCVYEPPPVQMAVTKSKRTWWWNDAERKRKRRVAKYKFYATEAKLKRSVKKGFRWFKIKCINIVTNL